MRTAIGYVRGSSEEQAEQGLGLEAQRQRVKAYFDILQQLTQCAEKELRW